MHNQRDVRLTYTFFASVYCLQNAASNGDIGAEASDHTREQHYESASRPFQPLFASHTLPPRINYSVSVLLVITHDNHSGECHDTAIHPVVFV
jgi:hypothetical protein